MLKIKDGVDLKELERFGFKYDEEMNYYYKKCLGTFNKFIVLTESDIDAVKGQIVFYNDSAFNTTLYLSTLYDLIEAEKNISKNIIVKLVMLYIFKTI